MACADTASSPNTLFFHGNALYGEERYAEAAAEYERVLAAGLESGPLYFNLGNAYFKAGDVGHAVLAYERALRTRGRARRCRHQPGHGMLGRLRLCRAGRAHYCRKAGQRSGTARQRQP